MKENKLIDMDRSIEALKRVTQQVLNEISHLRELSVGTLELVKLMEGYDEALEKLQTQVTTKPEEEPEKKLDLDVE
jgi:predicted ATP-grasp superfamily ATP-dependent carboligase